MVHLLLRRIPDHSIKSFLSKCDGILNRLRFSILDTLLLFLWSVGCGVFVTDSAEGRLCKSYGDFDSEICWLQFKKSDFVLRCALKFSGHVLRCVRWLQYLPLIPTSNTELSDGEKHPTAVIEHRPRRRQTNATIAHVLSLSLRRWLKSILHEGRLQTVLSSHLDSHLLISIRGSTYANHLEFRSWVLASEERIIRGCHEGPHMRREDCISKS